MSPLNTKSITIEGFSLYRYRHIGSAEIQFPDNSSTAHPPLCLKHPHAYLPFSKHIYRSPYVLAYTCESVHHFATSREAYSSTRTVSSGSACMWTKGSTLSSKERYQHLRFFNVFRHELYNCFRQRYVDSSASCRSSMSLCTGISSMCTLQY